MSRPRRDSIFASPSALSTPQLPEPRRRPRRPGVLALAFALALGLLGASTASATHVTDGCMQDIYNAYNGGQNLTCTANDVQLANVINVNIIDDGCAFPGDTVTFDADYEILLTAQERHDIGLYLAEDGGDALSGTCEIATLPLITDLDGTGDELGGIDNGGKTGACTGDNTQPCNEDTDCEVAGGSCEALGPEIQDSCGDIDNAPNPILTTINNLTIACIDNDFDGFVDLPNCTSWRQPGANELCLSPLYAFPGAPSKCRCDIINITEIPVPKTIKVVKELIPANDSGLFDLQVDSSTEFADAAVRSRAEFRVLDLEYDWIRELPEQMDDEVRSL